MHACLAVPFDLHRGKMIRKRMIRNVVLGLVLALTVSTQPSNAAAKKGRARVPGKMAAPVVLSATPTSLRIAYKFPKDRGNPATILSYEVTANNGTLDVGKTGSFTANGLDPNSVYTFAIRACNASGCGPFSAVLRAATLESAAPVTPPAVPAPVPVPAAPAPAAPVGPLVIGVDLPLQGWAGPTSQDTLRGLEIVMAVAGGMAGKFPVTLKPYDNSTAAKGSWDDLTCATNARLHLANPTEVAVLGTYNSGCSKIQVPILGGAQGASMVMISHANTNPGLTKAFDAGEPGKYYPAGVRNFGRVISTDDYQGSAGAQFAASLGLKRCVVLTDAQTYGVGIATAFKGEAQRRGIAISAERAWDSRQPSYRALFESFRPLNPDCFYLAGINDNNGEQVVRDKVAVFGPNSGAVKLLAPDGFTGYPSLLRTPESDGMYISYSGLPTAELAARSLAASAFVQAFKAKYGSEPSPYVLYGATALQLLLRAIAASDGSRRSVMSQSIGGVTIPAEQSLLGRPVTLDANGDVTIHDMSMQVVKGGQEVFLTTVVA
jgi:branched-chain amino acid transport system substrate-binding protein